MTSLRRPALVAAALLVPALALTACGGSSSSTASASASATASPSETVASASPSETVASASPSETVASASPSETATTEPSGTDSAGSVECTQAEVVDGTVTVDGVEVKNADGKVPALVITDDAQPVTDLICYDIIVGDGTTVAPGDTVTFNYEGAGFTTKQVFDSSFARGQAIQFPLTNLIPGWQQGIPGMKVGGRRLLIIPGDLAYGPAGNPPAIAENETLAFVIDVVSVP